jgi:urocanate hydratase
VNTASGASWVSIHHGGGVGLPPITRARSSWSTDRSSPGPRRSAC